MMPFRFFIFILFSLFLWNESKANVPKIKVITSFSVLGDLVRQVGGEYVDIKTLVGPDQDVHVYEPTPQDAKNLTFAQIVFINGLSFESWLTRLMKSAAYKGPVITATEGMTPRIPSKCCHPTEPDPHGWHSVENAKIYVNNIKKGLQKIDPERGSYYEQRATEYLKKLDDLEIWIRTTLKTKKNVNHKVITTHAAFGYLEDAYGVSFLSPVGISTDEEPSTRDMIHLINYIKKNKIKVIFLENISNKKLIEQIQEETGATIGGVLYSDGLSQKDGPAADYISMMRHNIGLIAQVMK